MVYVFKRVSYWKDLQEDVSIVYLIISNGQTTEGVTIHTYRVACEYMYNTWLDPLLN